MLFSGRRDRKRTAIFDTAIPMAMFKALLFIPVLLLTLTVFAASPVKDTLNRLNDKGQRIGWWVLNKDNRPVAHGELKAKEGRYINGRKFGAWINYYEDGVTPRLIGEYADNRPSGAYFRFDRKGKMKQASCVPSKIRVSQFIETSNTLFSCKMFFESREAVAGQVFFTRKIFNNKNVAVRFWLESAVKIESNEFTTVDYDWLDVNYNRLLLNYLLIRTPKKELPQAAIPQEIAEQMTRQEAHQETAEEREAREKHYYYPPVVRNPRVAKGLDFKPNGMNKLYSDQSEIWIDGYFKNGRLLDGKVFVYDRDGILLKVRVYKDGVYKTDGVL